ncbi:KGGVGR-motif variant AAA ATPase [Sorangium sp. So ce204]|uniref:MinD/ParA family ATP-binding protein n=1 Tax=Sorangium sp. So ce204 TaxID=3133288 RepID=UPI003F62807E
MIVDDLFGRVRVVVWPDVTGDDAALRASVDERLRQACAQYWTGDVWLAGTSAPPEDRLLYDTAWAEGVSVVPSDALRLNDRHRSRTAWFLPIEKSQPIWSASEGPPVIVFHSFKGGVGRTTALAAYAIARARAGERVAVVDFDLDAPGVGRLLDADGQGTTARWGVVDFLLEAKDDLPLSDYRHVCARERVTGEGRIEVYPAGMLDDAYLTKLSRIDLEAGADLSRHPLFRLLQRIREDEQRPSAILIDGRAGLSPAAGLLLSGFAHLHVLFATTSAQSLAGLSRIVRRLGFEQARRGLPQVECVIVQAMVPDNAEVGAIAEASFAADVEKTFREEYYAKQADEEDRLWSLDDLASSVAPHVPVPISYRGKLAFFETIDQIADVLAKESDYEKLCKRLDGRLAPPRIEDA